MREIKFRAWDGREMITKSVQSEYDDYYLLNLQGEFFPHTRTGDEYFVYSNDPLNKLKYVLMQFTGLLDKDGKEIYEGDILQIFPGIGPRSLAFVMFKDGAFCYEYTTAPQKPDYYPCSYPNKMSVHSVIGNIHENPELLELNGVNNEN